MKLTRERIHHLVGRSRVDDHGIAEIIRTGATESELVEALNRLAHGGEVGAEKMKPMSRRVAAVCEILGTSDDNLVDP